MRILVTGGAGFIGSHLIDALLLRDDVDEVVVIDNLVRGRIEWLGDCVNSQRLKLIQTDIRDIESIDELVRDFEIVFHLAAQSNVMGAVSDPQTCFSTNVGGTYNLLTAARKANVKRFIFTSSREVYGEPAHLPANTDSPLIPKNDYGASKIAAETYCRLYNGAMEVSILRLANVYGPRDTDRVIPLWLERAYAGLPLEVYGENRILDFIWVGHVVTALIKAGIEGIHIDEPINVASGKGTNLLECAEKIKSLTQSTSTIRVVQSRQPEVTRFVADVTLTKAKLGLPLDEDPLLHLPDIIKLSPLID